MSGLLAGLHTVTENVCGLKDLFISPYLAEPLPGSRHSLREVASVALSLHTSWKDKVPSACDLPPGLRGNESQDNPVLHVLTKCPWRGTKMNLPYLEFGFAIG